MLRNYYYSRDNHNTPARLDQREWAQGAYLCFRSGYTDTPIGVGIDLHGFYALELDGEGGSGGAGILPLNSKKEPESEFSSAGAAVKLRGLDNALEACDQYLENPVVAEGVSRLLFRPSWVRRQKTTAYRTYPFSIFCSQCMKALHVTTCTINPSRRRQLGFHQHAKYCRERQLAALGVGPKEFQCENIFQSRV